MVGRRRLCRDCRWSDARSAAGGQAESRDRQRGGPARSPAAYPVAAGDLRRAHPDRIRALSAWPRGIRRSSAAARRDKGATKAVHRKGTAVCRARVAGGSRVTFSLPTSRLPPPILALALAAFAIGTTEFVIMGILPDVGRDLGVSISSAGLLVSGYALGVAVGAPLLATLTARRPPKGTLISLMVVFVAGNLLSALAPTYESLMAGRVVASFAHSSFFGLGAVVAAGLVPVDRRAAAIALMFTGLTLANVLGVPLGTLIGQQFGWRATFWAGSAFGVIALGAVALLVHALHPPGPTSEAGWGSFAAPRA